MTLIDPLVSCICITHNDIRFLSRAIESFQRQTYPHKELVVAFSADNVAASDLIKKLTDSSIKTLVFEKSQALTLGEKRNLAIKFSSGFYFMVWDDDDWYHVARISTHVKSLEGSNYCSSVLSNVILYDGDASQAYLSSTRWAWEQTLFCRKSIFEDPAFRYRHLARGEDSPLVSMLKKSDLLLTISHPELYIYVYHGKNTFQRDHWEANLLQWATKLSEEQSLLIHKIVHGEMTINEGSEKLIQLFTA